MVPFTCKEVVEPEANLPVGKEGPCPRSQRGVEAQSGNDTGESVVIDVIEETFHVKEEHAAFEAQAMCGLNVMEEGEASVQAGGEPATPKLGRGDEFVLNNVVLEALSDDFLQ